MNVKKQFFLFLLICSYLIFNYYLFSGWWNSAIGTLLIVYFSYLIWPQQFLQNIGLKISARVLILALCLALILIYIAYIMMVYLGLNFILISYTSIGNYIHDVFYTLNEEIILGTLLLSYSIKKHKNHPIFISFAIALIFSLGHFVFYKWIFLAKGTLQPGTLITLFMLGFLRNNLILVTGHIGISWALHFSWVAVMFGSTHLIKLNHELLSEPEKFNLYLGSIEMFLISTILAVSSVFLFLKNGKFSRLKIRTDSFEFTN